MHTLPSCLCTRNCFAPSYAHISPDMLLFVRMCVCLLSPPQWRIQVRSSSASESRPITSLSLQLQEGLFSSKKTPSFSGSFSQLAGPPALLQHLLPSPLARASSTVQQAVKRADVRAQRAAWQQLKQLAGNSTGEKTQAGN